jgi:tetratricopeptide (TPR) repeat protein
VSLTEARHSLATALSTLRPRVGPAGLEASRDQVRLSPGRVRLDLDRLMAGDILGTEVTGTLEVAAFLDGFDIPDSTEFTHWKDRQQARLLPAIKDALVVLIDRCRRTGDSRQIEQLADRMLALDELSEEAIRAKMEARAFAGDRLTALEIFEQWKAKLADELQAAPSDLVEGMAIRLRRRGWERTTLTNIPNVPTDQWRGRPFIGRTAEYRVLYEAWEGARKGVPSHVLVLGDSGVGKTTLVERLTTAAGLQGAAISRVQCYDLEREIPYSTVSGLVLGLLDRPGVSATPPDSLAELARTVPEVRHRFPSIPVSSESQGETARIRLTEAFHDLLVAIAEEHPVILVVDDLHLADDVSLAVLHLIMRRARGQPIMVVLVARPGELPESPQAAKLRAATGVLGVREIELLPLTEPESLDLLQSLIPTDQPRPGQTVQRALLSAAAGYPMVLELLIQDWQVSGERSLALSVGAMTTHPDSGGTTPVIYRDILDRITRSLDPKTHNVLNLASLLGQRLNDPRMFQLVDLSVGQTMSSLADLVGRRVLRDGERGLEFVNEMVRAAAYVGVPLTLRKVLHEKIADCLMREHERGTDDLGLEIAWHCIRAGRTEEATPHLLRGAREAIRTGAPYSAEQGLSTALPNLGESAKLEALVLLAEALQEQSRWDDSLAPLNQIDLSQGSTASDAAFVLRTRAFRRLGYVDSTQLAELPQVLLAFMDSATDKRSQIKAALEAASIVNVTRNRVITRCMLDRVSLLAATPLEFDDKSQLLLAQAMLYYNINELDSSMASLEEAMKLLGTSNSPTLAHAMLQSGVGAIEAARGNYAAALPAFLKSFETGTRIGSAKLYLQAAANIALSLARLGDYQGGLAWAELALNETVEISVFAYGLTAAQAALIAYAMLGRDEKVEHMIRLGAERFGTVRWPGHAQAWMLYSADALSIIGKCTEAQDQARRATTGENARLYGDFCVGPYARWIARSSIALNRQLEGHEKLEALLQSLHQYDAIDQAEVLNAKVWLDKKTGHTSLNRVKEMEEHLASLPKAVEDQIARLGMVDLTWARD